MISAVILRIFLYEHFTVWHRYLELFRVSCVTWKVISRHIFREVSTHLFVKSDLRGSINQYTKHHTGLA